MKCLVLLQDILNELSKNLFTHAGYRNESLFIYIFDKVNNYKYVNIFTRDKNQIVTTLLSAEINRFSRRHDNTLYKQKYFHNEINVFAKYLVDISNFCSAQRLLF